MPSYCYSVVYCSVSSINSISRRNCVALIVYNSIDSSNTIAANTRVVYSSATFFFVVFSSCVGRGGGVRVGGTGGTVYGL